MKDETYHVLYGEISITLDGVRAGPKANDVVSIPRGSRHKFATRPALSSKKSLPTHAVDDSFYTDRTIDANRQSQDACDVLDGLAACRPSSGTSMMF